MRVSELCRKHGISWPTFYAWKAKFGGMSVSDAKRLKQLEDKNVRLKKLLAEMMLNNAVLKGISCRRRAVCCLALQAVPVHRPTAPEH
jgi:putative transposase